MKATFDGWNAKLPSPSECVLPLMLDAKAAAFGDKAMIVFDEGDTWTYREIRRQARGTAAALDRLGVGRGERVLTLLPDGPTIIRLSIGLYYLGAVNVPINTALKGAVLQHIINTPQSNLLIIHHSFLGRLEQLEMPHIKHVVVVGDSPTSTPAKGWEYLTEDTIAVIDDAPPDLDPPLQPWDVHTIFFTSGTTGPSKGVMCTHVHTWYMAVGGLPFLRSTDRFLSPFAYFHIAGAYVPWVVLHRNASMAVIDSFSTSRFWEQIQRTETTATIVIGAMADFLLKAPERDTDADNSLRVINQQPLAHDAPAFARRFGVELYTQYDLTELGPAIAAEVFTPDKPVEPGYCGRVREGFEVRLVDAFDREVPHGKVGEFSVRSTIPWIITPGYIGMPEATANAWRNGWFHTGDAMRRDEDGNFYYVDRMKDAIRRRGENISSAEVELEVVGFPTVRAVAAYGVPSEHSEDEVMIAVESKPGFETEPSALIEYLIPRMAHFMVPRYIRIVEQLPQNATGKIEKSQLRKDGVTGDTWDREAAGIVLKRERASSTSNPE